MYKYNKTFFDRMAAETGFIRDNLEKVFRLCDILQYLNENPFLQEHLALKGGTAINLTIFNLPRLSVDIDLDFTKFCTREDMLLVREQINKDLTSYMFSIGYSLSPNSKNPHSLDSWVFNYMNAGGNRDNIKVEINYSMRNHIFPIEKRRIDVDFLRTDYEICSLAKLELFGSKIKALIERNAPRDLYDIYNMLRMNLFDASEQGMLRKVVLFYCAVGGRGKLYSEFNFDSIDNLKFPKIRSSLIPLLKKSEHFDLEEAKAEVKNYLIVLMTLTGKEKFFVEAFNQKKYRPDLLFEDAEILQRIKEHPMAIWKMKKQV